MEEIKSSITEDTLKACLETAVQEFPANKHLAIGIGSVINRFFRSTDNNKFVAQTIKAIPEPEQSEITSSPGFSKWEPRKDAFSKKVLPLTSDPVKDHVAGKGISEVMERLANKVADKVSFKEVLQQVPEVPVVAVKEDKVTDQSANQTASDATANTAADDKTADDTANTTGTATPDPNRSPLLDLSVEDMSKMYGGLKGLKAFYKETLEMEPPRTANAEQMVKLIKAKLEKDAQS